MPTFHSFPRLPYELRMQIWELTVEPRTIKVQVKSLPWKINSENRGRTRPANYLVSTPAPAVLHACREARNHGLYQKGFSEVANPDGVGIQYVWLNWEIDMIDVGRSGFEYCTPISHLFRRFSFEASLEWEWFCRFEAHELCNFTNLKEIRVICAEPEGPLGWWHVFDGGHFWPCGNENVYLVDKISGQVFRGEEGLEEIERLYTRH